jgi:dihydroneopterin aldolase
VSRPGAVADEEAPAELDVVELKDLEVRCVVGLYGHERTRVQPLVVHLAMHLDLRAAGESDEVAHTVDYGRPRGRSALLCSSTRAFASSSRPPRPSLATCSCPPPPDVPRPAVQRVVVRIDKPEALRNLARPAVVLTRSAAQVAPVVERTGFGSVEILHRSEQVAVARVRAAAPTPGSTPTATPTRRRSRAHPGRQPRRPGPAPSLAHRRAVAASPAAPLAQPRPSGADPVACGAPTLGGRALRGGHRRLLPAAHHGLRPRRHARMSTPRTRRHGDSRAPRWWCRACPRGAAPCRSSTSPLRSSRWSCTACWRPAAVARPWCSRPWRASRPPTARCGSAACPLDPEERRHHLFYVPDAVAFASERARDLLSLARQSLRVDPPRGSATRSSASASATRSPLECASCRRARRSA